MGIESENENVIEDIESIKHDVDTSEEVEEMPRTQIPQMMTKQQSQHERAESKTPDVAEPTVSDLEMESSILGRTSIGKDAELLLQRARYKALEKNIANLIETNNEKTKEVNEKNKIIKKWVQI